MRIRALPGAAIALLLALGAAATQAATPDELLAAYSAEAKASASAERGQAFYGRNFGRDFAGCVACHTAKPTERGRDLVSEKVIAPLAPAANPARFTDRAKADHQFRVNCKDVVGRECNAQEKADLLAWLISLKP